MERKNIVVITFSLSNNGAERVFSELSNEWTRQGHHVTVIQFERNAFGSESFELAPGVEQVTLGRRDIKNKVRRYLAYLKDIRRYLKGHRDSVVIAFSFTTQAIVAVASLGLGNPIVFSERNDPNSCPYSSLARRMRNLAFHRAGKCVFQTEDAMSYFPKAIQRRGTVIVNPINPALPERYDGERRRVIITASRLRPQKNLPMLIEAFARFREAYPDYALEIYGIGELQAALEQLAKEKGVGDSVRFMGFSTDVNTRMRDASMYVCSSDYEGISNSMLEAMAMGIPTISTDCPIGGARLVIRDHENGILVPVRDVSALEKAMREVAESASLAARLSENGYLIRETFRVERIARRWMDFIDEK